MATMSITLGGGATAATPGSSKIRVTVFENDNVVDTQNYSGNDLEALETVILPLWRTIDGDDGCAEMEWDDSGMYVVFKDWEGNECPFPEELLTKRLGLKRSGRALVGDLIPVDPPRYGSNEWPANVKVKFTLVPSGDSTPHTTSAEQAQADWK